MTSLKACADALQALLDASEPEKGAVIETAKDVVIDAQAMQKLLERVISGAKSVRDKA
jgi:hypothetical protein